MIRDISNTSFNREVTDRKGVSVVKFWAPWCKVCSSYAPKYEKVASKYEGKVFFGSVDVEKNIKIADLLKIVVVPTTLIFLDGELKTGFQGIKDYKDLGDCIDKYLDK